mgnify:CR=1 FL=1|tara:strand:+ start:5439 stop:6590 length:1152 start_codon:yes stop_codon:yes gene_type:complete
MESFEFNLRTGLVFGVGSIDRVGTISKELSFTRPLLVADKGLQAAGHVERVVALLRDAHLDAVPFHEFDVNPDSEMITQGAVFARSQKVDSIIGLGGGSSLDCAKGINFVLSNGGTMADYRGYGKATKPMLPMIAAPTTAGTGSEAQSYAVISDAETKIKMACGDPKAAFRVAILDPELTLSQPEAVTAAAGFDAIAHAVETAVTTRRNAISAMYSREAFCLLNHHFENVLETPHDVMARAAMQLGAFYAGIAIEQSMLGAAHACANPLTARFQMAHGVALGIILPHVVRWNAQTSADLYRELISNSDKPRETMTTMDSGLQLADRLVNIGNACGFPSRLRDTGVLENDLEALARAAAEQWTGTFNPRPFSTSGALEVYECAY